MPFDIKNQSAIILLSGGLDSATTMAWAYQKGFRPLYALSFDYGQRHDFELKCAKKIARIYKAKKHTTIPLQVGHESSALLNKSSKVPVYKKRKSGDIPPTYVPARNTIFLAYALGLAEALRCYHIFIGVNAIDYSGYPDCRPAYINSFQTMANLATKAAVSGKKVKIHTPLIKKSKADIVRLAKKLKVDFCSTNSCYNPSKFGRACGRCDSCVLRKQGFKEAGILDQ